MWINVWVAGKTVSSLVKTCQPERFRDEYRTHYKALYIYKPVYCTYLFMVALCNRETIYIFMLWFVLLSSSFFFFSLA